ncbi:phenylalanine--tRNA ligase subunit alpha [bacterium (Candidatus Blackallbacteria) CG17_big_fil_post_rev_8_21_14_2_50_48_46]|uniref:Phenylalanine--tRNA ligase alpha subunit n=1 Tax=bacterium (Candidatus Blackallbacteria) CG17_big_fil_post_rev_8_21_14_2_50_48_46 TaxID=2014261 RepID=A0A2M7FZM0_9BACT|nr:MAG: phenylalanine--tRNA ligase subunit alpha [bacterium (Candidatus Blackallbacteria) CG18_big_fil_WC_8_21_14_2_50_49_26]PIW14791.1 MAG: phenylalanine--tRNA ligase subunit alpha [bacterium (Candidatus Blackallbacteria) CG17_big_fil_post_rev_8_21_14_2_50_48_46]PIW50893.1 MAG: phenylalanine--tRNA ligase subunit alpha [bacterium (Candidatus Blackallbacteria) CG13_big_fil_rev_8_21_14_2_50_49_14]
MKEQINTLQTQALAEITSASDEATLEALRIHYLGKKGAVRAFFQEMAKLSAEEKSVAGQLVNALKQAVEEALESRKHQLKANKFTDLDQKEWIDVTAPGIQPPQGHLHPITQIQYEIETIFRSMGFQVFDGPQLEDDYHNFEALNIPADHPARDMQDTFWLTNGRLLRTHTSSIQIRAMQGQTPPLRGISPGRVFRYEATDASHENTFYQVEGLMVDKDISVAHLIYVMKVLLKEIFQREVKVRLRPGFFPFVEPGFELDINCLICGGEGCPVCKYEGWVELLPCGAIHPNVLKACDIDPSVYTGFAFGLGLNRLVMMRYGINDIRYFQSGNLQFLEQF